MGSGREWTASDLVIEGTGNKADVYRAVLRGASPDADATDHRCAHRAAEVAAEKNKDIGFRCCQGPPNAAVIPAPKLGPIIRRATIEPARLTEIIAEFPQFARLKDGVRLFTEPDDVATVLRKGTGAGGANTGGGTSADGGAASSDATDQEGFTLTASPLLWNPAPGEELLVVAGRAKKDSFVAAFYRLPQDRFRFASAMVFADDVGPFVIAYNPKVRERLLWSSCWKCSGEGGAIALRDGRRVVVLQQ